MPHCSVTHFLDYDYTTTETATCPFKMVCSASVRNEVTNGDDDDVKWKTLNN